LHASQSDDFEQQAFVLRGVLQAALDDFEPAGKVIRVLRGKRSDQLAQTLPMAGG